MGWIIPSRYPTAPLMWAANQCGHTLLGGMAAFNSAMILFALSGEYPYKQPLFLAVALTYLFCVELVGQGWRGVDTIEDAGFVAAGAAMVLFPFAEIQPGMIGLIFDPMAFAAWAIGWQGYIIGGMIGRYINRCRVSRDA